ncbi:MAG: ATP-binding cassette domain-containing protein [Oscillospiraceae bacterium]|nr:ATP-binding cassette domain-containing protein [Oscillospiraceae bacterium]
MEHFKIENLTFSYPAASDRTVLKNVNLTIQKGEYIVLCGKSGSGKTTLLRHLKTVLTPHGSRTGQVLFHNTPLDRIGSGEQAARIGYVMQNPDDQIVTDKVWHELAFGLECLGCDQQTMRARVAEMACYFGIQDWFHRDVNALSGGQKQLLNLASIMAMQPEVLILDEPTSQLDPIAASDFLNTIRKINTELGTTVIVTEHRLEDIFPYADRVVVMKNGEIIADDAPGTIGKYLYEQKEELFLAMPTPMRVFYSAKGTGTCPLTVREGRKWLNRTVPDELMVRALPEQPVYDVQQKPVLTVKELWFRYEKNGPDILRGVSGQVPAGSLYAIVGGNGAGKSTLLKVLCGLNRPYRGKIKLFGKPLEQYKPEELFRNGVSMLPQDPKSLFVKKTVREELLEMDTDEKRLEQVSEICQITAVLDSHPYDLSGGEQQRAALAKVLLTQPRLLLLDEPTKGMDSFFKETFASVLQKLKQQGITVVMVSHDVEFCAQYADRVSMFFDGQLLSTGTPRQFFGANSFYTTAASRMSRGVFENAVTAGAVAELCRLNLEEQK